MTFLTELKKSYFGQFLESFFEKLLTKLKKQIKIFDGKKCIYTYSTQ